MKGKGRKLSEEHKAKLRLAKVGYSPWNKGKTGVQKSWRKGLKGTFSDKTIEKMRESHKGKKPSVETRKKMSNSQKKIGNKPPTLYGKNNFSWKGGVTPLNHRIRYGIEYDLWRNAVLARDGYTCQKTGEKGGKLHVHHILNFSDHIEIRFAIDNGITLSEKAHKEFHKIYGKKNNTKEQLIEFLNTNES